MSFHWTEANTGSPRVKTMCGLEVLSAWCARNYRNITCSKCVARVQLLSVSCPMVFRPGGEHVRGCGGVCQIKQTRVTHSFLRLCPTCRVDTLPAVVDGRGNQVRLPPPGLFRGMNGEDDEVRKGIKLKGNV